jgi:hypothetical protein
MKKKPTTFHFNIRLGVFSTLMREKLNYVKRDITEFNKFGVDELALTDAMDLNSTFSNILTDEELEGLQILATQSKDAAGTALKTDIGLIMKRAESKYGKDSGNYRRFGVEGIADLDGGQLVYVAKRVLRVATLLLTELASKGLTQAILTEYASSISTFEKALEAQEDSMAARDIATEERATSANELYTVVSDLCSTGKRIWENRNEAKYNDYLLYDTPSGEPETTPKGTGNDSTPVK